MAAQSGATATLATATRYMNTDHRHAPSKHSKTAEQIRGDDPGCLSAFLPFDKAGRPTLNVPADAVFTNRTGFEDASHIILNLAFFFFCFSSQLLERKPQSFLYHERTQ